MPSTVILAINRRARLGLSERQVGTRLETRRVKAPARSQKGSVGIGLTLTSCLAFRYVVQRLIVDAPSITGFLSPTVDNI